MELRFRQKLCKIGFRPANRKTRYDFDLSLIVKWNRRVLLIGTTDFKDSGAPLAKDLVLEGISLCRDCVMMYRDSMIYLPEDILYKVDGTAMAINLEIRSQLVDYRISEIDCRLLLGIKIRQLGPAFILRQILYRQVPEKLIDRPKAGFVFPIGQWLRGPLREWAKLSDTTLTRDGLPDHLPIQMIWKQHLEGTYAWTSRLWDALMFQAWMRERLT